MAETEEEQVVTRLRRVLDHPAPGWLIVAATFGALVWFWFKLPAPGVAVALLAASMGVMTFAKVSDLQRVFLAVIAVGLFVVEVRTINHERAEQQRSAAETLARIESDNATKTKAILDDNQRRFESTAKSFELLGRDASDNLRLSRENLENITGKGSFVYLYPELDHTQPFVQLTIRLHGRRPLTGVHIDYLVIVDRANKPVQRMDIGTVASTSFRSDSISVAPTSGHPVRIVAFINAQNGSALEDVVISRDRPGTGWVSSLRVCRVDNIPEFNSSIHVSGRSLLTLTISDSTEAGVMLPPLTCKGGKQWADR